MWWCPNWYPIHRILLPGRQTFTHRHASIVTSRCATGPFANQWPSLSSVGRRPPVCRSIAVCSRTALSQVLDISTAFSNPLHIIPLSTFYSLHCPVHNSQSTVHYCTRFGNSSIIPEPPRYSRNPQFTLQSPPTNQPSALSISLFIQSHRSHIRPYSPPRENNHTHTNTTSLPRHLPTTRHYVVLAHVSLSCSFRVDPVYGPRYAQPRRAWPRARRHPWLCHTRARVLVSHRRS